MLNFLLLLNFLITPIPQPSITQVQELVMQRSFMFKNPMPEPEAHLFASTVLEESGVISVPLILALVEVESKYNPKAKSKRACKGLLQLSRGTAKTMAKRLGMSKYNIFNIKTNIMFGVNYLSALLEENETIEKALTIYNRGWQGFVKHGKKISGYAKLVIKKSKQINELLKNDLTCKK